MRYTFQDSTVFPVQRDFIQDLQDFILISKEVLPLEKSAIKIKEENIQETISFEKMITETEGFEKDVRDYLESLTAEVKENVILEIKSITLETLSTAVLAKNNEKLEQLNKQHKLDLIEVEQLDTRILSILSPFFENSIYGAENAYYAAFENKKLKGKQVSFVDGMQYEYELAFTQDALKVKDIQNLILPIWVKSGLLSREAKVKKLDISDFYITSIEYEGNNLRTILEDREPENRFIISADEKSFHIQHRDYELTEDEGLAAAINKDAIDMFIIKLKELFKESLGEKTLRSITLDGKNVFDENRIFDCLKLIASKYGQLVTQCIERGYTEGEITIKIEESGRIRTEKYLEKSEILKELSTIGSEGKELAVTLRATEA
ncbi:MAG: hypothetical protein WCB90_14750 [Methanosarcina sp.]